MTNRIERIGGETVVLQPIQPPSNPETNQCESGGLLPIGQSLATLRRDINAVLPGVIGRRRANSVDPALAEARQEIAELHEALNEALEVVFHRGGVDWIRQHHPDAYERFTTGQIDLEKCI